jgi:uncharacterized protein
MAPVELEIFDIDNAKESKEAYALILKEKNGDRFFPVIIGFSEARAVVMELNKVVSRRPTPHDLFKHLSDVSGYALFRVFIYKFEEGVFFALLMLKDGEGNVYEIDSRTSDAVALALKFNAPVFIDGEIFEKIIITLGKDLHKNDPVATQKIEENKESEEKNINQQLSEMSVDELNILLAGAIESEDYELASQIHEEIEKHKGLI